MIRGVPEATHFSLRGRKARCCATTGVLGEASAPSRPGLHGSKDRRYVFDVISSLEVSWFDESFGTKLLTGASLLMNLIPSFLLRGWAIFR